MTVRIRTQRATEEQPAGLSGVSLIEAAEEPGHEVSRSRSILEMRVDATSYEDATRQIITWARSSLSRYVCVAAVNNVIEADDDARYLRVMNQADLITPDGMALVWGLRWLGVEGPTRVYGSYLIPSVFSHGLEQGIDVGLDGGNRKPHGSHCGH